MKLWVNGREQAADAGSLRELLLALGYDPERQGIAVALNDEVVRRGEWSTRRLDDGDRVEIVGAVQGG